MAARLLLTLAFAFLASWATSLPTVPPAPTDGLRGTADLHAPSGGDDRVIVWSPEDLTRMFELDESEEDETTDSGESLPPWHFGDRGPSAPDAVASGAFMRVGPAHAPIVDCALERSTRYRF